MFPDSICIHAFLPENRYLSPKQMLADLESALANRPLGNMEFEDVYSMSDPMAQTAEAPKIEPIPSPLTPPVAPKPAVQPTIPETEPPKPPAAPEVSSKSDPMRDKPVVSGRAKPPARQKPQKQKRKPMPARRALLLAAIAVCLIILLIVSLALRFGHTETPVLVERAVTAMLSVIEGSENVWLMI